MHFSGGNWHLLHVADILITCRRESGSIIVAPMNNATKVNPRKVLTQGHVSEPRALFSDATPSTLVQDQSGASAG